MKITQGELKARFILRDDGVFVNRHSGVKKNSRRIAGREVGCLDKDGYVSVSLHTNGRTETYKAHRLVWLWYFGEWPPCQIDHINHVKNDNRVENLRLATAAQNRANTPKRRNSTAAYKGVYRRGSRFHGMVQAGGKRFRIESQATAEEAFVKLQQLRIELHGEFACDGVDE